MTDAGGTQHSACIDRPHTAGRCRRDGQRALTKVLPAYMAPATLSTPAGMETGAESSAVGMGWSWKLIQCGGGWRSAQGRSLFQRDPLLVLTRCAGTTEGLHPSRTSVGAHFLALVGVQRGQADSDGKGDERADAVVGEVARQLPGRSRLIRAEGVQNKFSIQRERGRG